MQIRADQITEGGSQCGCGRSPTGKCVGWHALTEEQYMAKRNEYELAKYAQEAQNIWNDSCTSGRSE